MKTKIDKKDIDRRYAQIEQGFNEMAKRVFAGDQALTNEEKSLLAAWGISGSSLRTAEVLDKLNNAMSPPSVIAGICRVFRRDKAGEALLAAKVSMIENFEKGLLNIKSAQELHRQIEVVKQRLADSDAIAADSVQLASPMKVSRPISLAMRR